MLFVDTNRYWELLKIPVREIVGINFLLLFGFYMLTEAITTPSNTQ